MKRVRLAGWGIIMASMMLYAGEGWAGSIEQTFSGQAEEDYITNPLLNPADQGKSAWKTILTPNYGLMDVMGENVLKANLGVALIKSSNTQILADQANPDASMDWHHQNDKGGFGISASYQENSTILTEPSAIGFYTANSRRTSSNLAADWSQALSELTTLALNAGYSEVKYKNNSTSINNLASLSDYNESTGSAKLSYKLSEYSATFLDLSYLDMKASSGAFDTRLYNAMLGFNWNESERLTWTAEGGPSRVNRSGTAIGGTGNGGAGFQGSVKMDYKGQRSDLSLGVSRKSTPSGLGGLILTNQADGSFKYDLSEQNQTGVDLDWRKSDYLAGNLYRSESVWLHRDLSPAWGMKVYLMHRSSEWSALSVPGSASSNTLGLSVAYAHF
jgi:hypothetical protein